MLAEWYLKRLDWDDCNRHLEFKLDDLDLTNRRIERIKAKQKQNPDFKAYDVWADDLVDIATRLEEQTAIKYELDDDIEKIENRLYILNIKKEHPKARIVTPTVVQLSLFEGVMA